MIATVDRFSRPLRDLRISVTDRCNLRCRYCMPREAFGDDAVFLARKELLSFEEIARLARVFASLGVEKIRLTGGEPLLRREIEVLVAMIAEIDGISDVALTTNGTLLAAKARTLRDAGLSRVTVSLDALDEEIFRSMSDTRVPLARVLAGIDAALEAGLSPVKINMVVRRGVNDHCVLAMAERFRGRPETLRFIEYMDVGTTNGWRLEQVVSAGELRDVISARWPLEPIVPDRLGEVATRYRYRDGAGEVGFIHSVSAPFCASCTRARLSAEGRLHTCLFATRGHDLRALVRGGASDAELSREIALVWAARSDRYSAERAEQGSGRGGAEKKIEMSYIGG
jgi:cyclic pyranopterin phosphate synthase